MQFKHSEMHWPADRTVDTAGKFACSTVQIKGCKIKPGRLPSKHARILGLPTVSARRHHPLTGLDRLCSISRFQRLCSDSILHFQCNRLEMDGKNRMATDLGAQQPCYSHPWDTYTSVGKSHRITSYIYMHEYKARAPSAHGGTGILTSDTHW